MVGNTCASWHLASLDRQTKLTTCMVISIILPLLFSNTGNRGIINTIPASLSLLPPNNVSPSLSPSALIYCETSTSLSPGWLLWIFSLHPTLPALIHEVAKAIETQQPTSLPNHCWLPKRLRIEHNCSLVFFFFFWCVYMCVIICLMPAWLPVSFTVSIAGSPQQGTLCQTLCGALVSLCQRND